jgi:6-phosphogluconolactonase
MVLMQTASMSDMMENMVPEIVVDSPSHLTDTLVSLLEAEGRRSIARHGVFAIALPGGSVATTAFPRLARLDFPWSSSEIFWGDERAVPASDPESNYGLARSLWLEPTGVPNERIHPMPADAADLEAAAEAYADELVRVLGSPPVLDVALLGMGPDGHVCSLFPGHPLLREEKRLVAAVVDSPKPPPRRLTLTLPVVAAAGLVIVVATGAAKAAALAEALEDPASPLPVALVLRRCQRAAVLMDPEAASRLSASRRSPPDGR